MMDKEAFAEGTRTRTNTNPYGTKPMLRVEVGARALRNQAGGEGGLDTNLRHGVGGRASVVAFSRWNISTRVLMGHMPID